jgi:hypothetical protein
MQVQTHPRPYTIVFKSSGHAYPMSRADVDRLLAEYPVVKATRNRIDLRGDGQGNDTYIVAATLGGGDAFTVSR